MDEKAIVKQIRFGSQKSGKTYTFDEEHDKTLPAEIWFQQSDEGLILFVVFYTQACRWSRCLGCNLPSKVSQHHVSYKFVMAQIDSLMSDPEVSSKFETISKVIVSNNGSVLDQETFSSTGLMYLISQMNLYMPNLSVLSMETRPEYVEIEELEFISRALEEADTPTALELAVGFEAFDNRIRNEIFDKGLSLEVFEELVLKMSIYGYHLKCYFMQKPVPGMSDEEAVIDIQNAIDYLARLSNKYDLHINMHLNPTYVAEGTALETAFRANQYKPPRLRDVVRAVIHSRNKPISVYIGLSDEGLAVEGGSFLCGEESSLTARIEEFNRTQDYTILEQILG